MHFHVPCVNGMQPINYAIGYLYILFCIHLMLLTETKTFFSELGRPNYATEQWIRVMASIQFKLKEGSNMIPMLFCFCLCKECQTGVC